MVRPTPPAAARRWNAAPFAPETSASPWTNANAASSRARAIAPGRRTETISHSAAAGCCPEESGRIARYLVEANLVGHDSHGVIRVPSYIDWLRSGKVVANQSLEVVTETEGLAVVDGRFGDIWLRDTGPIFGRGERGLEARGFRFNGWGGKYELEHDDTVAAQIAEAAATPLKAYGFVLEGGAVDHDGQGTVLTTSQCVLNPNRNGDWTVADAESALADALGARQFIWLGEGLQNDHTDGHVDNLARFVAPATVACPVAWGRGDPNAEAYDDAARRLASMTDADGTKLKVVRIPSPGWIDGDDGPKPASHMNFLIANTAVIVPIYADRPGEFAVQVLKTLFPDRTVIGLPSSAILTGGGSFHCITQQEPA